jgi:hypothetical protein
MGPEDMAVDRQRLDNQALRDNEQQTVASQKNVQLNTSSAKGKPASFPVGNRKKTPRFGEIAFPQNQ